MTRPQQRQKKPQTHTNCKSIFGNFVLCRVLCWRIGDLVAGVNDVCVESIDWMVLIDKMATSQQLICGKETIKQKRKNCISVMCGLTLIWSWSRIYINWLTGIYVPLDNWIGHYGEYEETCSFFFLIVNNKRNWSLLLQSITCHWIMDVSNGRHSNNKWQQHVPLAILCKPAFTHNLILVNTKKNTYSETKRWN